MAVKIGSARIDERGRAFGGRAGDQTGREVGTQKWYSHPKGWRVFRPLDEAAAERIARAMEQACENENVGYDQYERNALWRLAKEVGFDISKVSEPCETDCSALVRVCCAYAGITTGDFTTADAPAALLRTGAFVEMKGDRYQDGELYLGRGDVLVTRTKGHAAVVLTNGRHFEGRAAPAAYAPGERVLRYGCEGDDVRLMQQRLILMGYDLGAWGADGEFGDCTDLAVKQFQRDHGLEADGIVGPVTMAAIEDALEKKEKIDRDAAADQTMQTVEIEGGDCYIRTAPNTSGKILGVARRGTTLPYQGETDGGWLLVIYQDTNAWVSGKYGRVAK